MSRINQSTDFPTINPFLHFRLNVHHRDMVDPRHQHAMDDLRQHAANSANLAAAAATSAMGMNPAAATTPGYDTKTSASAFSPIQAPAAVGSMGFSMPSSRNYFYDPLSFPKHHSQVRVQCRYLYLYQISVSFRMWLTITIS